MIKSRRDLKEYLTADNLIYQRNFGIKGFLQHLIDSPISDQKYIWKYIKTMRYAEYWINKYNSYKTPFALYYLYKLRKYGRKTGFQIHPNTCGKGIKIWHYGSIIINSRCAIGKNVTMRPPILLGHKLANEPSPIVGNNVEINSGVKIIGNIQIGDDVIIGPNAVVVSNIPSHSIAVGVPARVIKTRKSHNDIWIKNNNI